MTRQVSTNFAVMRIVYIQPAGHMQPSQRFCMSSLVFCCSNSSLHTDKLSLFNNLKFDLFNAGGPQFSATLSRLHCKISIPPMTSWCKIFQFSDFYLCAIGTKIAYEITLTEWLVVPNCHYHCSQDSNALSTLAYNRFRLLRSKLVIKCVALE